MVSGMPLDSSSAVAVGDFSGGTGHPGDTTGDNFIKSFTDGKQE